MSRKRELLSSRETKKSKTRREMNKESTQREILRAARRLFARYGYADTPLSAIVQAAKVTTGAVYHHFGDKKGLFRSVAESVEKEILERIGAQTLSVDDGWSKLTIGTTAILEIATEPDIRRIVFLDAPNVIGAATWREVELQFGFGAMHQLLVQLKAAGKISAPSVGVLAAMLLGALIEAANSVALAEDKTKALEDAKATISVFLEAIHMPEPDRDLANQPRTTLKLE